MSKFKPATRKRVFLKLAIMGPSGAGKTYSALRLATGLVAKKVSDKMKIAVIDAERGTASLYSHVTNFDVLTISAPFSGDQYIEGIQDAVSSKYEALAIDSLSPLWLNILDYKSDLDARGAGNSYVNWGPAGRKLQVVINTILQAPIPIICTMRSKQDYVLEANEKGRLAPRKVGMGPVMRDGVDYEFDAVFDLDSDHYAVVSKDRSGLFTDQKFLIAEAIGQKLLAWLDSATPSDPTAQSAISVQQQLLEAVADLDPEQLRAFLVARDKIPADGSILDVSASYAQQILTRFPEFREAVKQFRQESAQPDETATTIS